jgi:hypothetical protein
MEVKGKDDERLRRLERLGLLLAATEPMPLEMLRRPAPRPSQSVVAALLEEREAGPDVLDR